MQKDAPASRLDQEILQSNKHSHAHTETATPPYAHTPTPARPYALAHAHTHTHPHAGQMCYAGHTTRIDKACKSLQTTAGPPDQPNRSRHAHRHTQPARQATTSRSSQGEASKNQEAAAAATTTTTIARIHRLGASGHVISRHVPQKLKESIVHDCRSLMCSGT